jgi:hypothetical protein
MAIDFESSSWAQSNPTLVRDPLPNLMPPGLSMTRELHAPVSTRPIPRRCRAGFCFRARQLLLATLPRSRRRATIAHGTTPPRPATIAPRAQHWKPSPVVLPSSPHMPVGFSPLGALPACVIGDRSPSGATRSFFPFSTWETPFPYSNRISYSRNKALAQQKIPKIHHLRWFFPTRYQRGTPLKSSSLIDCQGLREELVTLLWNKAQLWISRVMIHDLTTTISHSLRPRKQITITESPVFSLVINCIFSVVEVLFSI